MSYWKQRYLDETNRLFEMSATATETELAVQYQNAFRRINAHLRSMYQDIITGNITSISELYRYNNYYDMRNYINDQLQKLSIREETILSKELTDLYIKQAISLNKPFGLSGRPNDALVKSAISAHWASDAKHWSDRVWKSRDMLASAIEQSIVDCATRGATVNEMTSELMRKFSVSYNQASRMARTEMTYLQGRASLDRYAEAGIEYYELLDAGDDRECEICQELVGRKFRMEDASAGENFPPLHPNCRCVCVAVVNPRETYKGQNETPKGKEAE